MNVLRLASMILPVMIAAPIAAAQGDAATKFFAEQQKDALRDLERGNDAEQITAADRLGAEFASRTAPVLAKHLRSGDTAIRLSAARTLWSLAGKSPGGYAAARPALEAALDDVNAEVAMNAAGALGAMKVSAEALAPARRRVLKEGNPQPYVLFLAARGLIGLDPPGTLAPALLEYLERVSLAAQRGGSRENVQLARSALEHLADTKDRAVIAPMLDLLQRTRSSQAVLLRVLHRFSPRPEGWTDTLLVHAGSQDRDVASLAWDLLGEQWDAPSLAKWAPRAAVLLGVADRRDMALSAFRRAAGKTAIGLPELAALASSGTAPEEQGIRALEIIGSAADTHMPDRSPEASGAALTQLLAACEPVYTGGAPGKFLDACLNPLSSAMPDAKERARHLARWLAANTDASVKVRYLEALEGLWSSAFDATDTVRAELANGDPRVKAAAEKALDRIRPAWRESGARQAKLQSAPAPRAGPAPAGSGAGADGQALFSALRSGDVAMVKKLVTRANVLQPVRYPQIQRPPTPLVAAVGHCGLPNIAPDKLAEIVAHLVSVGADPEGKDAQGDNILDRAKYTCPPQVMKALGG